LSHLTPQFPLQTKAMPPLDYRAWRERGPWKKNLYLASKAAAV
jgi:hypothetical protein